GHLHFFHEPAAELWSGRQSAKRAGPLVTVSLEQLALGNQQVRPTPVLVRQPGQGDLHADELGPGPGRVAVPRGPLGGLLVEPVGVDETGHVVVWKRSDSLEERLGVGLHGTPSDVFGCRKPSTPGRSRRILRFTPRLKELFSLS